MEPGGTAELPRPEGPGTPWAQWAGLQNKKEKWFTERDNPLVGPPTGGLGIGKKERNIFSLPPV